jgi:hypothetical protein
MIAASEIRVGNWLRYTIDEMAYNNKYRITEDKLVQVDSISYDHLLEKELPFSYCINHSSRRYFFPIELTEEILVKCGLKLKASDKIEELFHFNLPNSSISFFVCCLQNGEVKYENDGFVLVLVGGVSYSRIPCKYLHQLQNLYYTLTGEELIYTP